MVDGMSDGLCQGKASRVICPSVPAWSACQIHVVVRDVFIYAALSSSRKYILTDGVLSLSVQVTSFRGLGGWGGGVGWICVEGAISQSFCFLLLFLM